MKIFFGGLSEGIRWDIDPPPNATIKILIRGCRSACLWTLALQLKVHSPSSTRLASSLFGVGYITRCLLVKSVGVASQDSAIPIGCHKHVTRDASSQTGQGALRVADWLMLEAIYAHMICRQKETRWLGFCPPPPSTSLL